jgi:uncharacterized protein (TIGR03032 family)
VVLSAADGHPRQTFLRLPHPSGVAVDRERCRIHLACTRNPNQVVDLAPAAGDVPERVLVPVRARFYPGSLYMHDLALVHGELHANAVGQNAVVRLPEEGGHERVWWPRCIETEDGPDFSRNYLQLNSIAAGDDLASSYFSASTDRMSARRPGHRNFPVDRRGVVFSGATREPCATGLTRPHSARLRAGRVWVADSGYGELGVVEDGRFRAAARLPGWTRGLAFRDDVAFVGTSRVIPRFRHYAPGLEADRSTCAVHAVELASGRVLGSLTWPAGNQIFAVDWLPPELASPLPFTSGSASQTRRARSLFYNFAPVVVGSP